MDKTTGRTLAVMADEVRALNIDKGWRDPVSLARSTFGEMIALLHSEVSEALEAYRDGGLADATADDMESPEGVIVPSKPEGVGSELADVLIRLLDMADAYGFDLEAEYARKMAYNRTRPVRHGGKRL